MAKPLRVAVLASGGGSNLEALVQASEAGRLPGVVFSVVIASRPDAYALERARLHGLASKVVDPRRYGDDPEFQKVLLETLEQSETEVICLAGYLRKIGGGILQRFRGKILNIHPALLPKYGGAGMYGRHVHEAVIAAGEKESGCSVHLVDDQYDHGAVLGQARVPVLASDTPDTLAERVLLQEHRLYPTVVNQFCQRLMTGVSR